MNFVIKPMNFAGVNANNILDRTVRVSMKHIIYQSEIHRFGVCFGLN